MQLDPEVQNIVLDAFPDCRIAAHGELAGGVSARAVVLDVVHGDGTARRVVVRRPRCPTPEQSIAVAIREHALLTRAAALGLRGPKPWAVDAARGAVILEYAEGAPEFAPANEADMLAQMAAELARIHAVDPADFAFLPRRRDGVERDVLTAPDALDASLDEPRLRAALTALWPFRPANSEVLLHGDYWPGNMLWKDGRLAAVLDWEEAAIGDPLADISIARLDILWAFGEAAMHAFTERYRERARIDWEHLPRWDLCVALRPMSNLARWAGVYAGAPICRPDVTEATMRAGHRRFVQSALSSLGFEA